MKMFTRMVAAILAIMMAISCLVSCAEPCQHTSAAECTDPRCMTHRSTEELLLGITNATAAAAGSEVVTDCSYAELQAMVEELRAELGAKNTEMAETMAVVRAQLAQLIAEGEVSEDVLEDSGLTAEEKAELIGLRAQAKTDAKTISGLNAQAKADKGTIASLIKERDAALSDKEAAEKVVEELKAQIQPKHFLGLKDDGFLWVHIEDFLYAPGGVGAVVTTASGSALRALKGIKVKIYDDEHGDQHLEPMFSLPMLGAYEIALTADEGKTAFSAGFGNYSHKVGGLFSEFKPVQLVKKLTELPKNGGTGKKYYDLVFATGVVNQIDDSGSYRFGVDAGDYEPNPVYPKQPTTTTQQTIVKEVLEKIVEKTVYRCPICKQEQCSGHYLCKVCGKQDCSGHYLCKECGKEECSGHYTESTVFLCMFCGKQNCSGHFVKVCKTCGKEDCDGHVQTNTNTETVEVKVEVEVCMVCGKQDCDGHYKEVVIKVCKTCGEEDCDGHVQYVEVKVNWCGRCDRLMENCICGQTSNPENNPGRDDEDEFADETTGPDNNQTRPGEGDFAPGDNGPSDMPSGDSSSNRGDETDPEDKGPSNMPSGDSSSNRGDDDQFVDETDQEDKGPSNMPDNSGSRDDEGAFAP